MKLRALVFLAAFSTAAFAQFPARPITIIVPIPPGGAPDIAARVIADKLSQNIGQPVVVENKAGANGNIANEFVARSQPDGHTLGLLAPFRRQPALEIGHAVFRFGMPPDDQVHGAVECTASDAVKL